MQKKVKPVLLATDDKNAPLWKEDMGEGTSFLRMTVFTPSSTYKDNVLGYKTRRHLYIVDEEAPIEEGDTYYQTAIGKSVQKALSAGFKNGHKYFKVIASTDSYLGLPSISQSFLEQFVAVQGKGDVMMEMEGYYYESLGKRLESEHSEFKTKLDENGYVVLSIEQNNIILGEKGKQIINSLKQKRSINQDKVDKISQTVEEAANKQYPLPTDGDTKETIEQLQCRGAYKLGWQANPNQFTIEQMLEAITYGFEYHRDAMNDNVDVPEGNKLQWILGKYFDPLKHKEIIESWKKK